MHTNNIQVGTSRNAYTETFIPFYFYVIGDIGYYDKEGFFFVSDRIKELIKYKAFQVI